MRNSFSPDPLFQIADERGSRHIGRGGDAKIAYSDHLSKDWISFGNFIHTL